MQFGGVFSVLLPVCPSGDVDQDSLRRVIDLFLADGVNGFTALGVTSEVARLTEAERDLVLDTVLAHVNGRVPVVAGTTADGLRTCIEYSRRARQAGAAAVMISPPRMPEESTQTPWRGTSPTSPVWWTCRSSCRTTRRSRLCDGAGAARAHRAGVPAARTIKLEDPPTPLQDVAHPRAEPTTSTSGSSAGWVACFSSRS